MYTPPTVSVANGHSKVNPISSSSTSEQAPAKTVGLTAVSSPSVVNPTNGWFTDIFGTALKSEYFLTGTATNNQSSSSATASSVNGLGFGTSNLFARISAPVTITPANTKTTNVYGSLSRSELGPTATNLVSSSQQLPAQPMV